MKNYYWIISQILISANAFFLQVEVLKTGQSTYIASFSIFLSIQAFTLLLQRKLHGEGTLHNKEFSSRPPVFEISLGYTLVSLLLTFINHWNLYLCISFIMYTFINLYLDYGRFTRNHNVSNLFQIGSCLILVIIFVSSLLNINLTVTLFIIDCVILVYLICFTKPVLSSVFTLRERHRFDIHRGLDFIVSSGYNFFLPILVLYILNVNAVADLKSAQSFLSILNFYTVGLFLNELTSKRPIKKSIYIFSPTLIMSALQLFLIYTLNGSLPYFHGAFSRVPTLNWLLIVSLIFSQTASYANIVLIKNNQQRDIFIWHLKTVIPNIFIYFLLIKYFGIIGFGIASILTSSMDVFGLKMRIRKYE